MKLRPLTLDDMEQIRKWRNEEMGTLRTPFMLTKEMQEEYYKNVICNRDSHTRYWAFGPEESDSSEIWIAGLQGYGGIENIEWENRRGEISVLINPDFTDRGYGTSAVEAILDQAFKYLNLDTVFGECYYSGPVGFWVKILDKLGYYAHTTMLPMKKFYGGTYHNAFYFTIFKTKALVECSLYDVDNTLLKDYTGE